MALRRLNGLTSPAAGVEVTIYRDSENQEFVVKLAGNPAADYFTDDRQDATSTALDMFTRAVDEVCAILS